MKMYTYTCIMKFAYLTYDHKLMVFLFRQNITIITGFSKPYLN